MEQNIEQLIQQGRKQICFRNYKAAEKIFERVIQIDQHRKSHMQILIDMCHEEETKNETKDKKIQPEERSEGTENNAQRNEEYYEYQQEKLERGGSKEEKGEINHEVEKDTKELAVQTLSSNNAVVYMHHHWPSGNLKESKERGDGEMCKRRNLKWNTKIEHNGELGCYSGECKEENLKQRAMKRHTGLEEESRREARVKISNFCKKDNSIQIESAKKNADDHGSLQYSSNEVNKIYNEDEDNLEVKIPSKDNPEQSYDTYDKVEKFEHTTVFHKASENTQQKKSIGQECHKEVGPIRNKDDVVIEIERETEMLRMSLILRAYVMQIGIKSFSQKPNYRPDVNFDDVARCIDELILRAEKMFFDGNKKECEYYLSDAENVYSSVAIVLPKASVSKPKIIHKNQNENKESEQNTENSTANIAKSYKDFVRGDDIDVTKCLKLAESAILAKNFKKAERLLKKSERICPTKNARELYRNLEAAKKEVAELEAASEAAKKDNKTYDQPTLLKTEEDIDTCFEANEVLKTKETFKYASMKEAHNIDKNIVPIEQNDVTQNSEPVTKVADKQADKCIQIAENALNNIDFIKAERMLLKAKRIDPNINTEYLQAQIRKAIASRSSTTDDLEKNFQPSNNKKQNSKECVAISDNYLKQKNIPKAIEFLMKAKEYYNSNNLKEKFEIIEKLKVKMNSENSFKIAQPSFVNSNSETYFAKDPSQEDPPAYHIYKDQDADTVEKYLENGRSALKEGSLEKAEEYAKKAEQLRPGSAKGIMHDTNIIKNMRDCQESRLRSGHAWRVPGPPKHSEDTRMIAVAGQELSEEKLANPEDLKIAEKLKLTEKGEQQVPAIEKNQNTQHLRTHHNLHDSPSGTNENSSQFKNDSSPKRNIEKFIKNAEEAYLANNLNKAEHLLNEAYGIYPDKKILSYIHKIHKEKETIQNQKHKNSTNVFTRTILNEKVDNQNKQEAEKCVELAEHARGVGDLDKAERLFIKAQRMNPTDYIRCCLQEVKREKESKLIEKANKEKADYFVSLAVKAFESGANYSAEKYLQKALQWCNSDTTEQMLVKVQETIDQKIKNKKKHKSKIREEEEKEMKIEANNHLKIAKEQLNQGDLVNARYSALLSDSFYPSDEPKQLLHRIFDQKYEDEKQETMKSKQKDLEYNKNFKSELFIECARNAIADGDFIVAKQYLILSNALKESVAAKTMMYEVTTAINKVGQNTSSCRKVWEVIKNCIPSYFKK